MQFSIFCIFDHFADCGSVSDYLKNFGVLAERAEALGFDRVWISEHHFTPYGGIQPRPQMMLANLAARTKRIRLGTAVTLVPFDNPIRLAEDFALLDVLSGGRLDWGVGRGLFSFEYDGMGVSQDEGRERMEEGVEFVLRAWQEETIDFSGRFTNSKGLRVLPRPAQRPHPPIYAAAVSPQSVEWVARRGFNNLQVPYVAPLELTDERLAAWRDMLSREKHAHKPELAMLMHTYVGESSRAARAEAEPRLDRYLKLQAEHFPTTAKSKQYEVYAKMAPMVQSLTAAQLMEGRRAAIGDAEEVAAQLTNMRERFGMDEFIYFLNWGGMPMELTLASLERFASDVIPRVRSSVGK